MGLVVLLAGKPLSSALVYCNVTDLRFKQLSNGVSIEIEADGALDWEQGAGFQWGRSKTIPLHFPGARSKLGKNLYNVGLYPVSHITVGVPQDAQEGVGLDVVIYNQIPASFEIRATPSQQAIAITVESDRPIEVNNKKEKATESAGSTHTLSVRYQDEKLSVHAVKAKIHELLGRIAQETGINVVLDDTVQKEVSLHVTDLPVAEVIRGLASAYGLALLERGGVYMLSEGVPTDLGPYNLSGTETFPMRYVKAETAAGLLPTFLFQYLHKNDEQNAVVMTAPTQMLDKVRADLQKIDVAPPQILIEALALELTSTREKDLGLGLTFQDNRREVTSDSLLGELNFRVLDALPRDWEARLKALEQKGKARVLANPRMAVVNGRQATISIGSQRFIQVQFLQWGNQQERIETVDIGVRLEIRPWTGGNGEVTTFINTRFSNINQIDPQSGLPLLATREATTSVRVKDGETIVIGGLKLSQKFSTKRKVPILGDLPLLGPLFRSANKSEVESELVLFVTPHILTDEGRLSNADREREIRDRFLQEPATKR